jgi:hypothetical protein
VDRQARLFDDVLDSIVERATELASPLSAAHIEFYGRATNRVDVKDTAYPLREAKYALNAISVYGSSARRSKHPLVPRTMGRRSDRSRQAAST